MFDDSASLLFSAIHYLQKYSNSLLGVPFIPGCVPRNSPLYRVAERLGVDPLALKEAIKKVA
jgi:hypothetical protein